MSMTPEQAVDRLEELHAAASTALREALARFTETGTVPTAEERSRFRYPELAVDWQPAGIRARAVIKKAVVMKRTDIFSAPFWPCILEKRDYQYIKPPAGKARRGRLVVFFYNEFGRETLYTTCRI